MDHSRNNGLVALLTREEWHQPATTLPSHRRGKGSPCQAGQVCVLPDPTYGFIRFPGTLRPWRLA